MPTSIELTDRLFSDLSNAGLAIDGIHGVVSPWNPAVVTVIPANLQAVAQSIINAFDGSQAAQDAWASTINRSQRDAVLFMMQPDGSARAYRAIAALTIDEINTLREWIVSFQAAVAAASSLANLQTRVAALPNLPDRTLAQAKTAFIAKVNLGT
jgi:hypothetical protein